VGSSFGRFILFLILSCSCWVPLPVDSLSLLSGYFGRFDSFSFTFQSTWWKELVRGLTDADSIANQSVMLCVEFVFWVYQYRQSNVFKLICYWYFVTAAISTCILYTYTVNEGCLLNSISCIDFNRHANRVGAPIKKLQIDICDYSIEVNMFFLSQTSCPGLRLDRINWIKYDSRQLNIF